MIAEGPLLSEPAGAAERDSLYSVFEMNSTICWRKWANAPFKKTIQYFAKFPKLIIALF